MRRFIRKLGFDINRYPFPSSREGHLRRLLPQVGQAIDVGAHEGEFGALLRDLGFQGIIHSFEPLAKVRTSDDDLWHVHRVALGVRSGRAEMTEAGTMSSLLAPDPAALQESGLPGHARSLRSVEVRRLDDYNLDYSLATLLKTDSQGGDLEVLKGAPLAQIHALLFEAPLVSQYHAQPSMGEMIEFVHSHGFAVTGVYAVVRDVKGRLIELDVVAERL